MGSRTHKAGIRTASCRQPTAPFLFFNRNSSRTHTRLIGRDAGVPGNCNGGDGVPIKRKTRPQHAGNNIALKLTFSFWGTFFMCSS
ncbi:unnamed protein product [Victoria cruziana]